MRRSTCKRSTTTFTYSTQSSSTQRTSYGISIHKDKRRLHSTALTAVLDAQASRYRISGLITFHALTTQPHWEHSSSETHKRRGQPTPTWAEHTAWPMSTELPSQAPTRSIARCPARPASAAPAAAVITDWWAMSHEPAISNSTAVGQWCDPSVSQSPTSTQIIHSRSQLRGASVNNTFVELFNRNRIGNCRAGAARVSRGHRQ